MFFEEFSSSFKRVSTDERRRRLLVLALRAGLLGAIAPQTFAQSTGAGRSIHQLEGEVRVNNRMADISTVIRPGDEVVTAERSSIIFVVGDDAYSLRASSSVQIQGQGFIEIGRAHV